MKYRKIKNNNDFKLLFLLLIVIVILVNLFLSFLNKMKLNKFVKTELNIDQIVEDKGKSKNFSYDINNKYIVSINRPNFEDNKLNKEINDYLDIKLEGFKNHKLKDKYNDVNKIPYIISDYNSYINKNKIISYQIIVKEKYNNHIITSFKYTNYDMDKNKIIKLNDILLDESRPKINDRFKSHLKNFPEFSEYINNDDIIEKIETNKSLYNNFNIIEDNIIFHVPAYKLSEKYNKIYSFSVPLKDLEPFLKYNPQTYKKLSKKEIINKKKKLKGNINPNIDPNKPMVAITFDDGPNPNITPRIIEIFKKNNSSATFYILGQNAKAYPSILKEAKKNGNEIGNHSFSHKQLTAINNSTLKREVQETQDTIESIIKSKPITLRPTYGATNANVKNNIDMPLILWSIDTLDWKSRNKNSILNRTLPYVEDGDIILMHDLYESTADATEVIVSELKKRDFQLVTVSELFYYNKIKLKPGYIYTDAK